MLPSAVQNIFDGNGETFDVYSIKVTVIRMGNRDWSECKNLSYNKVG